jgi:hypothetical protein
MGPDGSDREYMSNIILNPGFEDGTTSWVFFTNGVVAFTADTVAPYSGSKDAKISITTIGTNTQLQQLNVPVVANTPYRLTFAAYSSGGRDMSVELIKNTTPFTDYGLGIYVPNLATGWSYFTKDFTTNASATNDARLKFGFNNYAANGDIYYIDEIKLEKLSEINGKMFSMF